MAENILKFGMKPEVMKEVAKDIPDGRIANIKERFPRA